MGGLNRATPLPSSTPCDSVVHHTDADYAVTSGGASVLLEPDLQGVLADTVVPTDAVFDPQGQVPRTPGTTQGTFAVGLDGSVSYSVPIRLPPGRAGVQPALSLKYSSYAG